MPASEQQLHVFLNETPMGTLRRSKGGKLSFAYDDAYLENEGAVPFSLSMPLQEDRYSHEKINPWLWGLLPDNELVIARWAQRFQVSASNPFGLLQGMGRNLLARTLRILDPWFFSISAERGSIGWHCLK